MTTVLNIYGRLVSYLLIDHTNSEICTKYKLKQLTCTCAHVTKSTHNANIIVESHQATYSLHVIPTYFNTQATSSSHDSLSLLLQTAKQTLDTWDNNSF